MAPAALVTYTAGIVSKTKATLLPQKSDVQCDPNFSLADNASLEWLVKAPKDASAPSASQSARSAFVCYGAYSDTSAISLSHNSATVTPSCGVICVHVCALLIHVSV